MKTTRFADRLDKTEPALIVKHGNTAKKHIALRRSGMTLGRARGCDIQLDAPDVSALQCVITRGAAGVFVRDCGSRHGTKVNGEKIEEAPLHNTDIIQIGTFSFEVFLPWNQTPTDIASTTLDAAKNRLGRIEKSRERLTGLALNLRRRLIEERQARAQSMVDTWPAPHHKRNEKANEELLRSVAEKEKALAERAAQIEAQAAELELQRQQLQQAPQSHGPSGAATMIGNPFHSEQAALEHRQQELDDYAARLRDAYEQMKRHETQLAQLAADVGQARQELDQKKQAQESNLSDFEEIKRSLETERAELEAARSGFQSRQGELDDLIAIVRDLSQQALRRHEADAHAFREIGEQLAKLT